MRLFEAIIEANHRAIAGDPNAGVRVVDFENELPVIALTCVDPRLNALFPNVLGLPGEQFIWLRNAGNIITAPLSSTMRSLALACAVKGGKEIAIIGHTDCKVCKTTTMQLLEKLQATGVERHLLPENINEYFGMFASEPQNVIKACDIVRHSPLIGPKTPVHGLLVDVESGKLEWIVNGYQNWETLGSPPTDAVKPPGQVLDGFKTMADFKMGEMKFPETKIGETVTKGHDQLSPAFGEIGLKSAGGIGTATTLKIGSGSAPHAAASDEEHLPKPEPPPPPIPPPISAATRIPYPRPVRPKLSMRRGGK
jgi:carbonic anhydrase